jgi:hypothetical protein
MGYAVLLDKQLERQAQESAKESRERAQTAKAAEQRRWLRDRITLELELQNNISEFIGLGSHVVGEAGYAPVKALALSVKAKARLLLGDNEATKIVGFCDRVVNAPSEFRAVFVEARTEADRINVLIEGHFREYEERLTLD